MLSWQYKYKARLIERKRARMGNHMDKVLEGLYVGRILAVNQKDKLLENKITHVLSIHDKAEPQYPGEFEYKCIQVADNSSSDLTPFFSECVEFIHQGRLKGGGVFVHCAAGISRSVTIVVLYIMTVSTLGYEDSLSVVQVCRASANPNFGFRLQLKTYSENDLDKERARIREKYPEMVKLTDQTQLETLLTKARDNPRRTDWEFDPDAFPSKKKD